MILNKIKINQTILGNRIVISPMCQYSSKNGSPSKWHYKHLSNLSFSGAGMIILDSIIRLIPEVISSEESSRLDSF